MQGLSTAYVQREAVNWLAYAAPVQPEQKIIANWLIRTKEKHGLSYGKWADDAGLGAATTITRAIKEDYASVTSVPTLDALAKAVGEPSVLDFLDGQVQPAADGPPALPSEEALASLLSVVLPLVRKSGGSASSVQSTRAAAAALQRGLEILGDQIASSDPATLGAAARGAVARFRDLQQQ